MDLKPDEFYELSFFEWVIYIEKHRRNIERAQLDVEIGWDYTRNLIASIWNVQLEKKDRLSPSEVIKLSWDKEEEVEPELSPEEYFQKVKKEFGSIKFKNGKQ